MVDDLILHLNIMEGKCNDMGVIIDLREMIRKRSDFALGEGNLHFSVHEYLVVEVRHRCEAVLNAMELYQCHILFL